MAQVDFTNAVLDVNPSSGSKPMNAGYYLALTYEAVLYDLNHVRISDSEHLSIITNTPSKVSILYTGVFTASGTVFNIGYAVFNSIMWKVSNISFSSGDTYSFVIDIEVSGNT